MHGEREPHPSLFRPAKARAIDRGEGCVARCVYCRNPMRVHTNAPAVPDDARAATLDHVDPNRKRGRNAPDNVVAACRSCNADKGHRTPAQWIKAGGPKDAATNAARQIATLPRQGAIRCLRELYGLPEAGGPWASPAISPALRRGY
jgi:hypothetical protein